MWLKQLTPQSATAQATSTTPIASIASLPLLACDETRGTWSACAALEPRAGVRTVAEAVENWRMEVSPFPNICKRYSH
jgi:hypothetical protein